MQGDQSGSENETQFTRSFPPISGDRFRVLFEQSSDAHLIFDETGITDCNPAAIRLLGAADRAAVLALHPSDLSPEFQPDGQRSDEKARAMDALARASGAHRFEWSHRRIDGAIVPVEVTLNCVDIDGRSAMIVVWHDLTNIKKAEADLKRHTSELEAANARLRRDLRAAARIQQAFLPTVLPATGLVKLAWVFRPCEELGGDLLNIFPIGERHLGLYMLDVSGHGVPASLLAVAVGHALSPHGDPEGLLRPADVIRRVNQRLCGDRTEQFVTLFYGVLDLASSTLKYANAGHPGPIVLTGGANPIVLPEAGLPAGVIAEAEYSDAVIQLQQRDRIWVYSDGLMEAMNPSGESFGMKRLTELFSTVSADELASAVQLVLGNVETWTAAGGPQDDISIVAVEVANPTSE
jgi:sigma-B regulation protein RsbU (phosphoserine phosphatase)